MEAITLPACYPLDSVEETRTDSEEFPWSVKFSDTVAHTAAKLMGGVGPILGIIPKVLEDRSGSLVGPSRQASGRATIGPRFRDRIMGKCKFFRHRAMPACHAWVTRQPPGHQWRSLGVFGSEVFGADRGVKGHADSHSPNIAAPTRIGRPLKGRHGRQDREEARRRSERRNAGCSGRWGGEVEPITKAVSVGRGRLWRGGRDRQVWG